MDTRPYLLKQQHIYLLSASYSFKIRKEIMILFIYVCALNIE